MPLLDDAKNCFVGQTQIKQIYAGTQKVWPKADQVPDVPTPIAIYVRVDLPSKEKFSVLFSFKDASCADMFNIYQNRQESSGEWTSFPYPIGHYSTQPDDPNPFNIYIPSADQFLYDDIYNVYQLAPHRMELRKNGTSTFGPSYVLPNPSTAPKLPSELRTNQCYNCDNSGRPVVPANFRVDTYINNSSQYACAWHRTPGQETTGWQTTTELKLAGSNSWTNKKTVSYPSVFTVYNKTEFGPNPTLQKQTEVRCKNIDPDGNTSCFVYEFPRT